MTVLARTLIQPVQLPAAQATQYTAPANTRTIIDKMTVTNPTAGALTVTVYIVQAAGAAGAGNVLISAQSVAAGAAYLCPEAVGHILNPGDFIAAFASAAASLVMRASGREVS